MEIAAYPIPPLYVPNEYTVYLSLADRALAMVSPNSREAGQLLSTLGWFTGLRDYESAHRAFERSYRIARRLVDTALEGRTLVNDAHVDFWHLRWQGCLEKSLRAIELAVGANDYRTEMVARSFAMRMYATMGESKEAAAHTIGMLEQAERFRENYWLVTARVNPLWLAVLMGDWQVARKLSEEGLALQSSDVRNLGSRALVESQVGDFARAESYADRLVKARRLSARGFPIEDAYVAGSLPLLANIAGADERLGQASEAAEAARSGDVVLPLIELFVTVGRGFTSVLRSDAAHAQEHHAALAPLRGTAFVVLCITVDRLLGLLARTAGQLEDALAHFEDGLTFCERWLPPRVRLDGVRVRTGSARARRAQRPDAVRRDASRSIGHRTRARYAAPDRPCACTRRSVTGHAPGPLSAHVIAKLVDATYQDVAEAQAPTESTLMTGPARKNAPA